MTNYKKRMLKRWKNGYCGIKQLEVVDFMGKDKPIKKYKQVWSAYNQAQTHEFTMFQDILIELIDSLILVRKPLWKNGRPFCDLKDMIFCCVTKCYYGKSSRRNTGFLEMAKSKEYIKKVPHFNTVLNYYKNPSLTSLLKHLVEQSGIPLKDLEDSFATDASGFSTSLYSRWLDVRIAKENKRKLYRKVHMTCGVRTNIISAISITEGHWHDSPQFGCLVKTTAKNFNMREMSADAGYMARNNYDAVSQVGAIPYIMFRSNAGNKARGSLVYKRMLDLYRKHREEFLFHYHKRSNSETVFSQIKRKFGTHLYSKSDIGQTNELLCICLAHNICILIQELFEANSILDFEQCDKITIRGGYCASH